MRLREILFVAASGNENSAIGKRTSRRASQDVVSVAAIKHDGAIWYGESGGTVGSSLGKVEFVGAWSPASSSTFYDNSTWNDDWADPWKCRDTSTVLAGYDQCTGTSMAAPHVIGDGR